MWIKMMKQKLKEIHKSIVLWLKLWKIIQLKKLVIIWYRKHYLWSQKYPLNAKQKEIYISWENNILEIGLLARMIQMPANMKWISKIGNVHYAIQRFQSLTFALITTKAKLRLSHKSSMKIASYKISKKNSNIRQPYLLIIRRHNQ